MNPPCQRCSKAVYPMEKLKCLDLFWHKQCFKCEECGTTLNLKTYKGYNKKPYCTAHCPKSSFTTVAETPEMLRLKQLSEQQSQIKYHEKFEEEKGKYTPVAADLETVRHAQNMQNVSSVKYHAEFEKQKGQKLSVDTDPEIERTKRNMATISNAEYHNLKQQRNEQEKRRPSDAEQYNEPAPQTHKIGSVADLDPMRNERNDHRHSSGGQYGGQPGYQHAPAQQQTSGRGTSKKEKKPKKPRYQALYDYTAGDDDEVSFMEGDIIVDTEVIDPGWMTGRVERTGKMGMLPSNYVERI